MPDISHTLIAKSDQLNAADLARPIVVTVRGVRVVREDQPVVVDIGDDYQPWKPCKGMRRLLARVWGTNTDDWPGHRVELYNDPEAKWAGAAVGGIRVSAISGIDRAIRYSMRTSKQGSTVYDVLALERAPAEVDPSEAREKFLAYAAGKGVTREQVEGYLAGSGAMLEDLSVDNLRDLARDLDKIRAHAAGESGDGRLGE